MLKVDGTSVAVGVLDVVTAEDHPLAIYKKLIYLLTEYSTTSP